MQVGDWKQGINKINVGVLAKNSMYFAYGGDLGFSLQTQKVKNSLQNLYKKLVNYTMIYTNGYLCSKLKPAQYIYDFEFTL